MQNTSENSYKSVLKYTSYHKKNRQYRATQKKIINVQQRNKKSSTSRYHINATFEKWNIISKLSDWKLF